MFLLSHQTQSVASVQSAQLVLAPQPVAFVDVFPSLPTRGQRADGSNQILLRRGNLSYGGNLTSIYA